MGSQCMPTNRPGSASFSAFVPPELLPRIAAPSQQLVPASGPCRSRTHRVTLRAPFPAVSGDIGLGVRSRIFCSICHHWVGQAGCFCVNTPEYWLKCGCYRFPAPSGQFTRRYILRYQAVLAIDVLQGRIGFTTCAA